MHHQALPVTIGITKTVQNLITSNMKKTLTFFFALAVSLLTLQASAQMYIVGDAPFGGWNPAGGVLMTGKPDGTYTYNVSGTLPANLKAWRCRVVAIISNYNSSDPNDCAVMQAATTANLNAPYVGIGEANEVSLNVYPNPATDYINIEAGSVINEVRVYNPMGQEVYTNNNVNSENLIVNMQDMATGMYMVTIRTDKGVASHRISVVR